MAACGAVIALAASADSARAVDPVPIPEGPGASSLPTFIGSPARAHSVSAPEPPTHPFMAPNGKSNIHDDAYQSDTYKISGPLGRGMERRSTFLSRECASTAFDQAGRLISICVGLDRPKLYMFDPATLETLATMDLPPRTVTGGDPFTDFSGGGYFYLDDNDRVVTPTTTRHIWVIRETGQPAFELEHDYDVTSAVGSDDKLISALPDWSGLLWFASTKGVVGTIDTRAGDPSTTIKSKDLDEPNGNSFAVDDDGGVYIVTDKALYRFDAASDGSPDVTWREEYPNTGEKKPGQTEAGSGTTPTVMGDDLVSITDNADPMDIVVYRRAKQVSGSRVVCKQPVFTKGQSATDNSLIATDKAMVVENNYGYKGPTTTENGGTVPGGLERVDVNSDGTRCRKVWKSGERAPSVVAKLSRGNGLVYTYTKDPRKDDQDAWYLTAIDFRNGKTIYKRLGGEGLGYNNHYAPITLRPDGSTAYVGVLGGLVALRDTGGSKQKP